MPKSKKINYLHIATLKCYGNLFFKCMRFSQLQFIPHNNPNVDWINYNKNSPREESWLSKVNLLSLTDLRSQTICES